MKTPLGIPFVGSTKGLFLPGKLEERVMKRFCVFGCMRTLGNRAACAIIRKEERALPVDGSLPLCCDEVTACLGKQRAVTSFYSEKSPILS